MVDLAGVPVHKHCIDVGKRTRTLIANEGNEPQSMM